MSRAELARRPKITFESDGRMNIYDPVSNKTETVSPDEMPNIAGLAQCPLEDPTECKVVPIQMLGSDDGAGNFGADGNPCPRSLPKRRYD